jgi:hypothetical protein
MAAALPAVAGTVSWNNAVTSGNWAGADNWVGGTRPAAGDDVSLAAADSISRTVTFANPDPALALNSLLVEAGGGGNFALVVGQDTLRVAADFTLGWSAAPPHAGRAVVAQSGASAVHVGGNLALASDPGRRAEYTIANAATLSVGGDLRVGDRGRGTFAQAGGTNVVAGTLHVGHPTAGGVGEYTLAGGSLRAGTVRVHAGGTLTVTGGRVGEDTGFAPTLVVHNAGTLAHTAGQFVGRVINTGMIQFNGPSFELRGGLVQQSATTLDLPATRFLRASGAGLHVVTGMTSSGTVSASQFMLGGFAPDAPGTYVQNGGQVAGSGNASQFSLIRGTYTLNAGRFEFPAVDLAGTFTHAAGTVSLHTLRVGGNNGKYLQTGGVLNVAPEGAVGFDSTVSLGLLDLGGTTNWGPGARLTVSGGTAVLGGLQSWHPTAALVVTGGRVTLATDAAGTGAAHLDLTLTGGQTRFAATQHLASLAANNVGHAVLEPGPTPGGKVLVTKRLTLGGSARLDLTNNALVLDHEPTASPGDLLAPIRAAIASGRGGGPGLASSTAAADPSKALGYARASEVLTFGPGGDATFLGQAVDASSVLVRYTLAGDANLDGGVDFADLVRLAQNYDAAPANGSTWFNGDFTYDGVVDFNDLVRLAQNYDAALPTGPIPGMRGNFATDLDAAFASVPEPSAPVALLAACGLAGSARRHRRRAAAAR